MPNNATLIAKWLGKKEKALASGICMQAGAWLGSGIAPIVAVWIIAKWNWQAVFYIYGGSGIALAIVWYILARDFPHLHPRVNRAELEYITEESLEKVKRITETRTCPMEDIFPLKSVLGRRPSVFLSRLHGVFVSVLASHLPARG